MQVLVQKIMLIDHVSLFQKLMHFPLFFFFMRDILDRWNERLLVAARVSLRHCDDDVMSQFYIILPESFFSY